MNEKTKKILDIIFKAILIIIIIVLLIHNCSAGKEKKEEDDGGKILTPTGNVDVIELLCDKKDKCDVDPKDDKDNKDNNNGNNNNGNGNNGNNGGNNTTPVNGDDTPDEPEEEDENKLIVKDDEAIWHGEVSARMFTNSMYVLDDVIAPESSNTYQFVVKNGTDYKLKYNITFVETNPYNINMKYKLKKGDTYLIDHYVSASELIVDESLINSKSNDTYYLEWKWVSSDNDTEIGKTADANYKLVIKVDAESVNG